MENKGETRQEGTGVPRPLYSLEQYAALIEGRPYNPEPDPEYGYLTEGKDLVSAFTELVREAKAVRYKMFDYVLHKAPSSPHTTRRSFGVEREGFRTAIGDPKGYIYGRTFARALRELHRWVPVPLTKGGHTFEVTVVQDTSLVGCPEGTSIVPTVFDGPLLERWQRWVSDFEIEVDVCAKRFIEEPDFRAELERLKAEVQRFEVGTAEGAEVRVRIEAVAAGRELLEVMNTGKELLMRSLRNIAEEYAPVEDPGDRVMWLGDIGELAELFAQLAAKRWIQRPAKGGAGLGRMIHRHFSDREGKPFNLATLTKYMQPEGARPTREGVVFEMPDAPDFKA